MPPFFNYDVSRSWRIESYSIIEFIVKRKQTFLDA